MPTHFTIAPAADGRGLVLSGDLDTDAAERLESDLPSLVSGVEGKLILDVTRLGYLNSIGIRAFLRLDKLLKARGASIAFKGTSLSVFRHFRYCGLDAYFTFVEPDLATLQGHSPARESLTC